MPKTIDGTHTHTTGTIRQRGHWVLLGKQSIPLDLKSIRINGMNGHASGTFTSFQSRRKTRHEYVKGIDDETESTSTACSNNGSNCW
jgi:hypothetical protein